MEEDIEIIISRNYEKIPQALKDFQQKVNYLEN